MSWWIHAPEASAVTLKDSEVFSDIVVWRPKAIRSRLRVKGETTRRLIPGGSGPFFPDWHPQQLLHAAMPLEGLAALRSRSIWLHMFEQFFFVAIKIVNRDEVPV